MSKQFEIYNFQNLSVQNAHIKTHALKDYKEIKEDTISVVFIREPLAYFDSMLYDYLKYKRSILFTQDIIDNMKELRGENFLQWLDTLNFLPFYNPQTFQLDSSKRVEVAIENLNRFDYVVPYDEIDIFLKHIPSHLLIEKDKVHKLLFSLRSYEEHALTERFIKKDMQIYEEAWKLWDLIKKNNFKPLRALITPKKVKDKTSLRRDREQLKNYKGITGQISATRIAGWVFHKDNDEYITVAIYKNDICLCFAKADILRNDLKNQNIHPTGECGFEVVFEEKMFDKGDNIAVKILPHETPLPLGKSVQEYLAV